MKYIHILISIVIIIIGAFTFSITINNEIIRNIVLKMIGFVILIVGSFYLRRVTKI